MHILIHIQTCKHCYQHKIFWFHNDEISSFPITLLDPMWVKSVCICSVSWIVLNASCRKNYFPIAVPGSKICVVSESVICTMAWCPGSCIALLIIRLYGCSCEVTLHPFFSSIFERNIIDTNKSLVQIVTDVYFCLGCMHEMQGVTLWNVGTKKGDLIWQRNEVEKLHCSLMCVVSYHNFGTWFVYMEIIPCKVVVRYSFNWFACLTFLTTQKEL